MSVWCNAFCLHNTSKSEVQVHPKNLNLVFKSFKTCMIKDILRIFFFSYKGSKWGVMLFFKIFYVPQKKIVQIWNDVRFFIFGWTVPLMESEWISLCVTVNSKWHHYVTACHSASSATHLWRRSSLSLHFICSVVISSHLYSLGLLIFRFWHITFIALLTMFIVVVIILIIHIMVIINLLYIEILIIMLRLYFSQLCLTYSNPLQSGSDVSVSHEFRGQRRLFSYCALGRVYDLPVRWPPDLGWLTG